MPSRTDNLNGFREFLTQRKYRPATITSYVSAVDKLFAFCANEEPTEISVIQLDEFTHYLSKRKGLSVPTVRTYLSAFELFYNSFLHKKYDINALKPPPSKKMVAEILSPEEMRSLLQALLLNADQYLIISLIYSAGLSLSQVLSLKVGDVDCEKKKIKITDEGGCIIRKAILSDHLVNKIKIYMQYSHPTELIFKRRGTGKPYASSTTQKAYKKALLSANIEKKVTIQNLKHTYIKHLELYGTPLSVALKEMGLVSAETYCLYSKIGLTDETVSFSPLDRILHERHVTGFDTTRIEKSFSVLKDGDEKSYLLEAIKCFNAMAPRAAIILAWNAAIRNIQNSCLKSGPTALNGAIRKHRPNAPRIDVIEDFEKIAEGIILQSSCTLKVFSKHEKDILVDCLNLRNKCGHPSAYMPKEHRVASFLEDLHNIVFRKTPQRVDTNTKPTGFIKTPKDDEIPF